MQKFRRPWAFCSGCYLCSWTYGGSCYWPTAAWFWEVFCDPFNFSIVGVDPTFNLGKFSVTPIVYRHLLLEDAKSHKAPLVLGPMLIQHRKQFRTYHYFLSTVVGLRPELSHIQAVGTDGEKALVDATGKCFPHASQLRCFRHLQQNIESCLRDKQFPQNAITEYTWENFGFVNSDDVVHEGLVDPTHQ